MVRKTLIFVAIASSFGQYETRDADVTACLQESGVGLTFPEEDLFGSIYQFQLLSPLLADAIAFPETRREIADLLACARLDPDQKVSVLGGQHSFVGYGFGNAGNLVISMENFREMKYNEEDETIWFEGGSRIGPVAKYLWDNYGRLYSHVRSGSVGIPGSVIGGGFGTIARMIGLPSDTLVEVEYMLPCGKIVVSHKYEEPDLLWAAQGAGSSYGVILSMRLRTYKPLYSEGWRGDLRATSSTSLEDITQSFLAVQDYLATQNDTLSFRVHFSTKFKVTMADYGNPDTFEARLQILEEKLKEVAPDMKLEWSTKSRLSMWDLELATSGSTMNDSYEMMNVPVRAFYTQALCTQGDQPLNEEEASLIFKNSIFGDSIDDIKVSGFLDYMGGYISNVSDNDSAYIHGNNLWLIRLDGRLADDPEIGEEFVWPADADVGLKARMLSIEDLFIENGRELRGFANYRDRQLTREQWSARLYGKNYEKLVCLKKKYDPTGMFTSNDQAIPIV